MPSGSATASGSCAAAATSRDPPRMSRHPVHIAAAAPSTIDSGGTASRSQRPRNSRDQAARDCPMSEGYGERQGQRCTTYVPVGDVVVLPRESVAVTEYVTVPMLVGVARNATHTPPCKVIACVPWSLAEFHDTMTVSVESSEIATVKPGWIGPAHPSAV